MKIKKYLILLPIFIFFNSNFTFANSQIGSISCNVLEDEALTVRTTVYSSDNDQKISFGTIELKKNSSVIKKWENVPIENLSSASFSILFKNEDVKFEAWYDDVGAMSELEFDGKSFQLQCDIELPIE